MKSLKEYQENAVKKLFDRVKMLLYEEGKETIIFQSPTGSGKTLMASKLIEELSIVMEDDLCYLWISIGKSGLHEQSYRKVKKDISDSVECSLIQDEFFGSRNVISKNEIVFINWEKIRNKNKKTGEWSNELMKDKETINFIQVLENTRQAGRKIVLIIDECHSNASTDRAVELRDEVVKPEITIEMSATPTLYGKHDSIVKVNPNDVISEGMIKKEILINPNIDRMDVDELDSQELILEAAYRKRKELKKLYETIGSDVNPLVLIQVPDAKVGEEKKDFAKKFLKSKDITESNNKLAIYLSEEKVNQDQEILTKNNNTVEFLIFKKAIDTGWDCPRAQILVKFRETKSIVFEIQTVGRILRMPEVKHYTIEDLNTSYVYTNILSISVAKETYNPNIIKSLKSNACNISSPIKLNSYYRNRVDFGDITADFHDTYLNKFKETYKLIPKDFDNNIRKLAKSGFIIENIEPKDDLLIDEKIKADSVDTTNKLEASSNYFHALYSPIDLQNKFDNIIEKNLNGFPPARSFSKVKTAIFKSFKDYLKQDGIDVIEIQKLVVSNEELFSVLLNEAVLEYKAKREKIIGNKESGENNPNWEIPITKNFNSETTTMIESKLSLHQPLYVRLQANGKPNKLELEFINYLDKFIYDIDWFWQNGQEHMKSNFGIKKPDGTTFQPDFIVKFKNGHIGIFDTKAEADRELDTKIKAETLQRYIVSENEKGGNLIGGIVIKPNKSSYFYINNRLEFRNFKNYPEDWTYFNEFIKIDIG